MTTLITTGNLTKDAAIKSTKNGISYVLLNLAENIHKKNKDGSFARDDNGNYITLQTIYLSVFVYDKEEIETASNLIKGQAVMISGRLNIKTVKGSNGFNQNVLESITAYTVDADPFKKLSNYEAEKSETQEPEIAE